MKWSKRSKKEQKRIAQEQEELKLGTDRQHRKDLNKMRLKAGLPPVCRQRSRRPKTKKQRKQARRGF